MTYAIARHKLFDVRAAIVRSISFTVLLSLFALLYSFIFFFIINQFLDYLPSWIKTLIFALLLVPIMYSFDSIKRFLQRRTEKIFYKNFYDIDQTAKLLAEEINGTLELKKLINDVIRQLEGILQVEGIRVLIGKNKQAKIYENSTLLSNHDQLVQFLYLVKKIRRRKLSYLLLSDTPEGKLKETFRALSTELVFLFEATSGIIGGGFFPPKNNGDPYTSQDIQLLSIVVPQLSVALQNSQSYEEISKFNTTLKEEVKKATTKLKSMNQNLRNLDRLKDEFLSIASHELRTPMTAIKSYIYMTLSGKGGKVTKKQKYYLERSYMATERLIKLVNNLLNISRIESGRISLELEKINLYRLTDEVFDEVRARAEELGLSISQTKLEEQKKLEVIADTDKVKEVLINYIGNSLKFTPKGGSITVSYEVADDMIWTRVTDTGAGVSQEDLGNLFQKFGLMEGSYQVNQNVSQGTGLGLYICKSVIELHGGEVDATSPGVGKGTVFSFSLPLYTAKKYLGLKKKFGGKDGVGIVHTSAS
ncbi:MAG: HAMP domain-containing histidine kinase [Pseudomonadales bacterium]|nr:HAMP domain-containing histidine kinase [Pseudomonadales bacterium]